MMSKSVTGIFVTGTVTFRLLRLFLPHRRHRALLVKARTETQQLIVKERAYDNHHGFSSRNCKSSMGES
jgi:hypothetical protein